jgi:hydroxymethylbilane synthase
MTQAARLRLGVRAGRLAQIIAEEVAEALKQAHSSLEIEIVKIAATGDHVHDRAKPLPGFTRDLDLALAEGRVDFAVHDMTDLPAVRPDSFVLAAVPRRRHPFDVLLTRDSRILDELEENERIAASTLCRRAQLAAYRPDLRVLAARGGLEAQLKQLEDGEYEGLVLAATDAERLGLHDLVSEIFTTEVCVPWPGQGALALEVMASRSDVLPLLQAVEDGGSRCAAIAERAWLNELGDDDDLPVGALANAVERELVMEAVVVSPDGQEIVRDEIDGPLKSAEALGAKLATRMIDRGAEEILSAARGDLDVE